MDMASRRSKLKKAAAGALSFLTALLMLSAGFTAFAVIGVDTQYTYASMDPSWLSDITVKEDMTTIEGLSSSSTLEPVTDYKYDHTADSFREEIGYYQKLYTLDASLNNSSYLYLMDLAKQFAGAAADDSVSDEYVKTSLIKKGVVWPAGDETENLIAARALYAFLTANPQYSVTPGTGLYDAFTTYLSQMLGVDTAAMLVYDADATLSSIEEYILAASKYTLYRKGYNVTSATSADETYRLMAVMSVRERGITIDAENATQDEIKNKYLCAMMSKVYDIEPDVGSFAQAVASNSLPSYILRCIGKTSGLAVKPDASYNSAFETVRDNSDRFDLENQFYADITEYNVRLKNLRSKIWISLMPFVSNAQDNALSLKINGSPVESTYYNSVSLNKNKASEKVTIDVSGIADGVRFARTYILNIIQGATEAASAGTTVSAALSTISAAVEKAVSDMGQGTPFSGIMAQLPFSISNRVLSISSLLFPSTDGVDFGSFVTQVFGYARTGLSGLKDLATTAVGGIGGLDAFLASIGGGGKNGGQTPVSATPLSVSFSSAAESNGADINNLQVIPQPAPVQAQESPAAQPVNAPVIIAQDNAPGAETLNGSQNWLRAFFSNPANVVVFAIVLAAVFFISAVLFAKILKYKNAADAIEGKAKNGPKR